MRRTIIVIAALLSALGTVVPSLARAAWLPYGNPVRVHYDAMFYPSVLSDERGGAFVSWAHYPTWVQRLDVAGGIAAGWPGDGVQVPIDHRSWGDAVGALAPDGAGGVYVLHSVKGEFCDAGCNLEPCRPWLQRFTAEGRIAAGWPAGGVLVGGGITIAYAPVAASDGRGGVLIAWFDGAAHVQRVDAHGAVLWGPDGVVLSPADQHPSAPALLSDGEGGSFVVWGDHRGGASASTAYGQHVLATGRAAWGSRGVAVMRDTIRVDGYFEPPPLVAADGAGGAIVALVGTRAARPGVWAARVTREGRRVWPHDLAVCDAPGAKSWGRMMASPGGAIVAWIDARRAPAGDVVVQRLSRAGRCEWGTDGVSVCAAPGMRSLLALASDGRDGAYLAWGDTRTTGEFFGVRLTGEGHLAEGWPTDGAVICGEVPLIIPNWRELGWLSIASLRDGNAMVAWQDVRPAYNSDGEGLDIEQVVAMLLTPHGPANRHAGSSSGVLVDRATPALVDAARPTFALRSVAPNPARLAGAVVRFALPNAAAATLELFDVAGRRLWSRDVGSLGAGEHAVTLRDRLPSPPGLYLVRLRQAERVASTRVVLTR